MECACCRRSIEPLFAIRGRRESFFCGTFCADSEIDDFRMLPSDIQDAGDISIETAPLVVSDATGSAA
jgi:hypothetical protein